MRFAFDTARLRIFSDVVKPTDHNEKRLLFVGFRTDEDRPMVAVTCLLWLAVPQIGDVIDWLEVASELRRKGFGAEFRAGLNKCLGKEPYTGAGSEDGRAFLAALAARGIVTQERSMV